MKSAIPGKLHCYAFKDNDVDQWVACCLDFTLVAQADTFKEAVSKLENMINEYVYDATEGAFKDFKPNLLKRRAPIGDWIRYYFLLLHNSFFSVKDSPRKLNLRAHRIIVAHR